MPRRSRRSRRSRDGWGDPETLSKWIRQAEIDPGALGGDHFDPVRYRRGQAWNAALEQTIGILKAATSFFVRRANRDVGDLRVPGTRLGSVAPSTSVRVVSHSAPADGAREAQT